MFEQGCKSINVWQMISRELAKEGIDPKFKGYKYLKAAVHLAVKDSKKIEAMTKEIYMQIAADHSTTAAAVERSIRYAVSKASIPEVTSKTRTNKKFITDISMCVLYEIEAFVNQNC